MSLPIHQIVKVGFYIIRKRLQGIKRYPLVLMLEPLFRCNLACGGCGKIDYPDEILDQRLSIDECLSAVEECDSPVVSICGGEPLIHHQLPEITAEIINRNKYVYICTNALLLKKRIKEFTPSKYLIFSVHLDGKRDRHDASVCRAGSFDKAIDAINTTIQAGFRVTINCTFFQSETPEEVAEFFDFVMALGTEAISVSPGFSYEHAPQQQVFLRRESTKRLFRDIFKLGKRRSWSFNQSSLYLDFLAGNQTYRCTPWGLPTRNIFGWQKPCYLLVDEGYAPSFQALLEETDWEGYGTGRNPKCANCMAHCGYEPTAVADAMAHPWKAAKVFVRGPGTTGPMAPELPIVNLVPRP